MSIVKNKRSLSSLEFYNTARKLRLDLTNFLLRDFGVRNRVYKETNEDNKQITITEEYPKWIIENFRYKLSQQIRPLCKRSFRNQILWSLHGRHLFNPYRQGILKTLP